jgi:hypothetical protein
LGLKERTEKVKNKTCEILSVLRAGSGSSPFPIIGTELDRVSGHEGRDEMGLYF